MNKNFVKYIVGVFVLLTFVALLMPKQQNRENVFLRDEDLSRHILRHSQNSLVFMLTYYGDSGKENFDEIALSEAGKMTVYRGVTGILSHQVVSGMLLPDEMEKSISVAQSIRNLQAYTANVRNGFFIIASLGERNDFFVKSFSSESAITKDLCIIFDVAASLYQREGRLDPPQCPL